MNSGDILVEIPNHDLPKLAALFEEKAPWAPYMVSFVHTAMKWKENAKYKEKIVFLSPHNCWEEDGTIIAKIQLVTQDFVVFTLDDQCTNLYKGLVETNLITHGTNIRSQFYAVHEKHVPTVKKYLETKQIKVVDDVPCFIYAITPEEAKKITFECPSDVYIKRLEPPAAKQINGLWPHRFLNSDKYLATYIDANGGYGIVLKSTDQMVAWIIKHAFGHLAMLQTAEEHKRKGYASLLIKVLSKEIAEEGHWPLGTILLENEKSIAMFEKLGFHNIGICNFIIF